MICDWHKCNRSVDRVDGWGFAACEGHFIAGTANKNSHGMAAITAEEYGIEISRAKQWLRDNPNPKLETA